MDANGPIVGIGEILWDLFPEGPRFGGAPANFACHAAALAGSATMVSGVGRDAMGRQAIETLTVHGVETRQVARLAEYPTGSVKVQIDHAGRASYHFGDDEAWDHLAWSAELAELAGRTAAVCFGTLGQRHAESRETIRRFVAATPRDALRIFDVNLRAHYFDDDVIRHSLELASVLKLSDEELPRVAQACGLAGDAGETLAELARRYQLNTVALTRGAEGALLWHAGQMSDCPGVPVEVRDSVGAGDAFTAAMAHGLVCARPLDAVNRRACRIAAYVCSQPGGTPALPAELIGWD